MPNPIPLSPFVYVYLSLSLSLSHAPSLTLSSPLFFSKLAPRSAAKARERLQPRDKGHYTITLLGQKSSSPPRQGLVRGDHRAELGQNQNNTSKLSNFDNAVTKLEASLDINSRSPFLPSRRTILTTQGKRRSFSVTMPRSSVALS